MAAWFMDSPVARGGRIRRRTCTGQRTIGPVTVGVHPGERTPPGSRHDGAGREDALRVSSSATPIVIGPLGFAAWMWEPRGKAPARQWKAAPGPFFLFFMSLACAVRSGIQIGIRLSKRHNVD